MLAVLALLAVANAAAVVEREPFRIGLSRIAVGLEKRGETLTSSKWSTVLHMNISVGTPPQNLLVPITTYYADKLVLGTVAVGDPNVNTGNRTVFHPSESGTFELGTTTSPYGVQTSDYVGTVAHDTVRVGSVSMPKQELLMGSLADIDLIYPEVSSGTVGMAGFSPSAGFGYDLAAAAGVSEVGIFVLGSNAHMGEWSYGLNAGELNIGGPNHQLYTGDINYLNLDGNDDWEVLLEGIKVNGVSVPVATDPPPASPPTAHVADIDNWIGLKDALAFLIFAQIPNSRFLFDPTTNATNWYVPCQTIATISVLLGGQEYILPASKWVASQQQGTSDCLTLFQSYKYDNPAEYSDIALGLPFAATVYTVLKFGPTPQVGFARLSDAALAHTAEEADSAGAKPTGSIPGASAAGSSNDNGTDNNGGPPGAAGSGTAEGNASSGGTRAGLSWVPLVGALALYFL